MADYLNIAGRVRTTASDGVAMEAQEVKDLNLNKSQQEINADVQTELGDRYTKEETYNREEIEELVDPTNYVSVVATDATTAVTDVLPATGEANTIYRVGNWDGTQYDPTMYALYAWNGSAYVCLAVRSFVGEVYDISVNHPDGQGNPTPYADLTAALGTSGANIPADIRRGGMSIKFIQGNVQSSDNNKYVQYFLTKDEWSASEGDWEKMNLEEEVSLLGQEKLDVSATEKLIDAESGGYFVNLENVSVGDTYTISKEFSLYYDYWIIPCETGDQFSITTARNTAKAQAYAVLDANGVVLAIHQAAVTSEKISIPVGGVKLIVNSRTHDGDVYSVVSLLGKLVKQSEFELLKDGVDDIDAEVDEKVGFSNTKAEVSIYRTGKYVELYSAAVGSIYEFTETINENFGYWKILCEHGDVFKLTTAQNGIGAKAYCILDSEGEVLEVHQNSVTDKIVEIPETGKTLIVNSRIATGDVYSVISLLGRFTRRTEFDSLEDRVNIIDANINEVPVSFESGSVNYLNGRDSISGLSIRTGHIKILDDSVLKLQFSRTVSDLYIIKYLDDVYAGYSSIKYNKDTSYESVTKDSTFNTIRIRADVSANNWTSEQISLSSCNVFLADSIVEFIKDTKKFIEEANDDYKELYFRTNHFANLSGITSVGDTWDGVYEYVDSTWGCVVYECAGGDIFEIKTSGNTSTAKSYAFLDRENKVLAFQQAAYNGKITAPLGANILIVNSKLDVGNVIKLHGLSVSHSELQKNPFYYKKITFESGFVNYLNGKRSNNKKCIRTYFAFTEIRNSFLLSFDVKKYLYGPYCHLIKYKDGEYVGYKDFTVSNGSIEDLLVEADGTFNEFDICLGSENSEFSAEEVKDSVCYMFSIDSKFVNFIKGIADFKKYQIANSDNEFSFDFLSALEAKTLLLRLIPNFNVPNNGAYLSTDIDYTNVRTSPISDTQLTRANVPYLYLNGEKRGTIVLYDIDGTPYIYDKNGNKRNLTLS